MARNGTDGAAFVRPAKRSDQQTSAEFQPLLVDPVTGALIVTGAGASPSATAIKLEDRNTAGQRAAVDVDGRVHVALEGTTFETRFDYAERADANPVYIGKAPNGAGTTSAMWNIRRLSYDASNRPVRIQVLTGAWDDRAGPGVVGGVESLRRPRRVTQSSAVRAACIAWRRFWTHGR